MWTNLFLRRPFREVAGVLASAAAYFFGTGLNGFAPLVWLAPIPVLGLAFHASARRSALIAFLAYVLGGLNMAAYLMRLVPPAPAIAALVVPALAFALAVLAQRYVLLHWQRWAGVFVFPAAWTSYEFLLARVSPDGTALNIAYSQALVLPIIQLAALTGIWGISFLITLLPAGLVAAWHWRRQRQLALAALSVAVWIALLALGYGWLRLARPQPFSTLRVAAVASDETVEFFNTSNRGQALPVLRRFTTRVEELARTGALVVVLPEKFVGVAPAYEEEAVDLLREASRQNQLIVIAGLNRVGRDSSRNTAFVLGHDGNLLLEYDKAFLVTGFERGYQRGTLPGVVEVFGVTAGIAICKDMDFPGWLRRYSARGAKIVFVPAWDFVDDGALHARMAVLRGVEGGFAVVRSAQQGLVTVSDHMGRIVAQRASSESQDVMVVEEITLGPGHTLYSRAGDCFGVTSLVIIVLTLGSAARRARRRPVRAATHTPVADTRSRSRAVRHGGDDA
jgi:apolipoprotein N-acyltransferase